MSKMRQKADEGLLLGQETPNAPGETSSEMNIFPMAFTLNQSSAVCLPLVSDSQRLIWVHSNEINLQMDGAAELDKAFDQFPYLTETQTASLAKRCSLHPDQVKVWFMVQRLRYGISWDSKDIIKVRTKIKAGRVKEELQNEKGEEVKEGGTEAGEIREEQKASEGEILGHNERFETKMKQEQPVKKEKKKRKVEEDKGNAQKKRKRMTVTDKMGKKRLKQGEGSVVEKAKVETRSDEAETECEKSAHLIDRKKKKKKSDKRLLSAEERPVHESLDVPPLNDRPTELLKTVDTYTLDFLTNSVKSEYEGETEMQMHAESTTAVGKLMELMDMNNNRVLADGSSTVTQQQHAVNTHTQLPRFRRTAMTQTQLDQMRAAFLHSQYPDGKEYDRLATVINVPRNEVVQWFSDTRYYIKRKAKPYWMSQEQHSRALATVKHQQLLWKMQRQEIGDESDKKATVKFEASSE